MDYLLFIGFIITSVILIIVPGPNVLVVVSTSISHGTRRGLQTVLGTSSAMLMQLIIAALGTAWFVAFIADGLVWLKWLGVGYLIYLGVSHLLSLKNDRAHSSKLTACGTFARGFVVSLTNPKTILFFSAFLPQFVSHSADYSMQIVLLSVTFLVLATLLDSLYALTAGRIAQHLQSQRVRKVQSGLSGLLLLSAGTWLAAMRKT